MNNFQLSTHFSLDEFTQSSTAVRLCIPNVPSVAMVGTLTNTALKMELVRHLLGENAINVDSAYRSPALNMAIHGATNSAHTFGYAVDFTCPAYGTPAAIVAKLLEQGIKFDQLILEGTWVHISFDPRMRQQVLEAHFGAAGTTYIPYTSY